MGNNTKGWEDNWGVACSQLHLGDEVFNDGFVGPELACTTLEHHTSEPQVLYHTDFHFPVDHILARAMRALKEAHLRVEKDDPVLSQNTGNFQYNIDRVFRRRCFNIEDGWGRKKGGDERGSFGKKRKKRKKKNQPLTILSRREPSTM